MQSPSDTADRFKYQKICLSFEQKIDMIMSHHTSPAHHDAAQSTNGIRNMANRTTESQWLSGKHKKAVYFTTLPEKRGKESNNV